MPGIETDTSWCFVDKACKGGHHLDGFSYDVCSQEGGRVTEAGVPCQLPATYHGIPMYDCISYNHSTPGAQTPKPWCYTNQTKSAWGYCAPWSCSAAIKLNCPAADPSTSNYGGYAAPACLETLCNARLDLVNITLCTQDTAQDKAMLQGRYAALASSAEFGQLLNSTASSGGLSSQPWVPL